MMEKPKPNPEENQRKCEEFDQRGWVAVASWDAYPWLRAGFSARQGGTSFAYSAGGPGELNLGWTDSDDAANVAENRRRLLAAVAGRDAVALADEASLVTLRQVHGSVVHLVAAGQEPFASSDGRALLQGDGLMTLQAGLMLGVQTADCVPVLVADTRTHAVAAFHAGWRGTLARIVEQGIAGMQANFGSQPRDLIAAIGPSIRACCFAVGQDVRSHFEHEFPYAQELFSTVEDHSGPQLHMDLQKANRGQLLDAGVLPAAVAVIAECSACQRLPDGRRKYFSHRAEQGFTGRMMSVIGTIG